jgi:hypothetical protein
MSARSWSGMAGRWFSLLTALGGGGYLLGRGASAAELTLLGAMALAGAVGFALGRGAR